MTGAPQSLSVQVHECKMGCIHFTVSLGAQSIEIHASSLYDPFHKLIAWLEAIAVGVQHCSFEIDEEGLGNKRLEFSRISHDRSTVVIYELYNKGVDRLAGDVDPIQLVTEMYRKLTDFFHSDKYDPEEWEQLTVEDRLAGRIPREQILDGLLGMSGAELTALFQHVAPTTMLSFQGETDGAAFPRVVAHMLDPDDPEKAKGIVETNLGWETPPDYDNWTTEKKAELLRQCLESQVGAWNGAKPGEFRSRIVEDWIEQRPRQE